MPQIFPSEQLRVSQHEPPELNVVTIGRPISRAGRTNKLLELQEAFARLLNPDTLRGGLVPAVITETGHSPRIFCTPAVARSQRISKRALALRSPHNAVEIPGSGVILHQREQESSITGIVQAKSGRVPAVYVTFLQLLDTRNIRSKHIFEPGEIFHAALSRDRKHCFEDIERAEIRRPNIFERRIGKVLRVNGRVTSAVKRAGVVLLFSMVRQRLPRDLPPRDTAAVRECRDK